MNLNKQKALDIINREPVGGAGFYSTHTKKFYITLLGNWFVFAGSWTKCHLPAATREKMIPMYELLAIAEGEG